MQITVNGETIPAALFEQEKDRLHMEPESPPYEELDDIVKNNLVSRTLLRQAAEKGNHEIAPEEVDEALADLKQEAGSEEMFYHRYGITSEQDHLVREEIKLTLIVEKLMDEIAADVTEPADDDIEVFYREHQADLVENEQVEAAHILKNVCCGEEAPDAYEKMQRLREKLLDGADFSKAANEESDSDEPGGHLGRFAKGQLPPEFESIAFSMRQGEISPVFQTQHGYHIIKVLDHAKPRKLSLDEAADRIRRHLRDDRKNELIEQWVRHAETKADITIDID